MDKKIEKTLCILLLTMFISTVTMNNARAPANQTKLYVDPPSIIDPTFSIFRACIIGNFY